MLIQYDFKLIALRINFEAYLSLILVRAPTLQSIILLDKHHSGVANTLLYRWPRQNSHVGVLRPMLTKMPRVAGQIG